MGKGKSLLFSKYILDGEPQELTPSRMMGCTTAPQEDYGTIVDERLDPSPLPLSYDSSKVGEYCEKIASLKYSFPLAFSSRHTRSLIAGAVIDTLWRGGHFLLEDISLEAKWKWSSGEAGIQAAFYDSVKSACEYVDSLGLAPCKFEFSKGEGSLEVKTFPSGKPIVGRKMDKDKESWIVYVPFDTSNFSLGGSALSAGLGQGGGVAPECNDPDYFMDCFEVVREFVEDGVVLSGCTVGRGGLITALKSLKGGVGVDLTDLLRSYKGSDIVSILFAEVPGVVIQIRDSDFDYIDAEFLLQDVMYFPLGHPDASLGGVVVKSAQKSGIENILSSLLR